MTMLSVVIPAYNEEDSIAGICNRVLAMRPDLVQVGVAQLELLVVDDGSSDKTIDIASQINDVRVIQHSQNRGYGAALKTGFGQAKGELIGFLDADGTYPPEYFPELCKHALNGADLVVGTRMSGSDSQMPVTRKIGNRFFAGLLSIISRQHITDSASGMRVFKRDILERLYPLPNGLNLTPVMSTRATHEGIRMAEVPIPYSERQGNSKLSVIRDGSVFLHSMLWTALTYNPVRILGILGLFGVGLAVLSALGILSARLQGSTSLTSWQVAMLYGGLVAGVIGVNLFSLGIVFNYLVALFYKQPIRQGLFGKPLFKRPLDQQFWWMGGLLLLAGIMIGIVSVVLGISGWETGRLWLYMLGSAMLTLTGVQLIIYWIILRALDELSQRDRMIQQDLQ